MPPRAQAQVGVAAMAMSLLRELEGTLTARGLRTVVDEADWSLVAASPVQGLLSQRVVLAPADTGELCWYWQLGGRPDEAVEHEPICRGLATGEATERISRVLSVAV